MAAPHVTAVAALVASRYPAMTAPDIRAHILATGKPVPRLAGRVATPVFLELPAEPGRPFADVRGRFAGEVGAVARAGIMQGMPAPDAPGTLLFKPDASLTRAEAAAVAVRAHDYLRQRARP